MIIADKGVDRSSGEDRNTTALIVSTPDEVLGLSSDKRAVLDCKHQHEQKDLVVQLNHRQLPDLLR